MKCVPQRLETGVGVGDHQLDALEATGPQAAHEGQPAGPVLDGDHVEPQDLAVAVIVDAYANQAGHVHDPPALAALQHQRVQPEVLEGATQRPLQEALHHPVELLREQRDLALRQLLDPHRLDRVLDPPRRDAEQVRLGDRRGQCLLGPPRGTPPPCPATPSQGPRRLGIAELETRLGVHRATIGRWYRAGALPRPHFIGNRRAWWLHEVAAWEESRVARSMAERQNNLKRANGDG